MREIPKANWVRNERPWRHTCRVILVNDDILCIRKSRSWRKMACSFVFNIFFWVFHIGKCVVFVFYWKWNNNIIFNNIQDRESSRCWVWLLIISMVERLIDLTNFFWDVEKFSDSWYAYKLYRKNEAQMN